MHEFPLELMKKLVAPIPPELVKTRSQGGIALSYITARTVMNRLDSVLGPTGWTADYEMFGTTGIKCTLKIKVPVNETETVTIVRVGIGGFADMKNQDDSEASGESHALKRAGAALGIARELYGDGMPTWLDQPHVVKVNPTTPVERTPYSQPATPANRNTSQIRFPANSKQAYPFIKNLEKLYEVSLLNVIAEEAKRNGYSARTNEWNTQELETMTEYIAHLVKSFPNYGGELEEALKSRGIDWSQTKPFNV